MMEWESFSEETKQMWNEKFEFTWDSLYLRHNFEEFQPEPAPTTVEDHDIFRHGSIEACIAGDSLLNPAVASVPHHQPETRTTGVIESQQQQTVKRRRGRPRKVQQEPTSPPPKKKKTSKHPE
jgi:hypothetical protein